MNRRAFLKTGATVSIAATSGAITPRAAVNKPRTNFVYFLCDDLGYGDLHCFGHPEIQTPNLDSFADEGMKLTSCYSAAPVCSPARAGFLTGRIPERCAIYDHIKSPRFKDTHNIEYARMSPKEITIAELLKDDGYETCLVGKWHLDTRFDDLTGVGMPDNQGFDYYMATENNAASSHKNPRNFIRNGEKLGNYYSGASTIQLTEKMGRKERWR
jgi:arylsulfatase A